MTSAKVRPNKRTDLLILVAIILIAIPITILLHVNFLTSTLLFFGVPSLFLIWRRPKNLLKASLGGIVLGLILGFSFDFVAEFNHAWGWAADFALPGTFFGIVSLDVLVWYFLWVFLVIAYYEYFVEQDRSKKISPHATWIAALGLMLILSILTIWKLAPQVLVLTNAYALLGSLTFMICFFLLYRNPNLIKKVLQVLPFFIFMYLAYEITALHMHLWIFPGAYVGLVSIEGTTFPLEELLIWIIASSAIVATYYEYCIDDDR